MHTTLTQELETLQNRFELLKVIGQGAQGKTFLGLDNQSGHPVAIKELQMDHVQEWQAIDLFDREARVLETISHPAIPAFIDAFQTPANTQHGTRSFIVQEFVDGDNLKALLDTGLLVNESTARAFLTEMLTVLNHLHTLPQPIIHCDIKLSNIIRRRDQRLALIDFGAVQFHTPDDEISPNTRPTIVGTAGYMPLEQMMGKTVPATDIYALAATTIHLLSRRHPADLPVAGMAMQFQEFINVSAPFQQILQKMLAPHLEDRFASATEVLSALEKTSHARSTAIQFEKPIDEEQFFNSWNEQALTSHNQSTALDTSRPETFVTKVVKADDRLHLTFPRAPKNFRYTISGAVAAFCALMLIVTTTGAINGFVNALQTGGWILMTIISLWFGKHIIEDINNEHSFEIDATTLHHHIRGLFGTKTTSIPLETIELVKVSTGQHTDNHGRTTNAELPGIEIHHNQKTIKAGLLVPKEELIYWVATIRKKALDAQKQLTP